MNVLSRTELTPRETQCIQLAAGGLKDVEIASELGVKPETVKSHLKHAYRVLGARNRAHAVALGLKRGVIS